MPDQTQLTPADVSYLVGIDPLHDGPAVIAIREGDGTVRLVDPAPAADHGDILARIDAAVEQMTRSVQLCACGCRVAVRPDSASPDFASPSCQRRWHAQHAHDPEDVYRRPDAAEYALVDSARVPLWPDRAAVSPGATTEPEQARRSPRYMPPQVSAGLQSYGPTNLTYQRHCEQCRAWTTPVIGTALGNPFSFRDPMPPVTQPLDLELSQHCADCRAEMPGPVYTAEVTNIAGRLHFVLTDDIARVRRVLSHLDLQRAVAPDAMVRGVWGTCERELTRFRAGFHHPRLGDY